MPDNLVSHTSKIASQVLDKTLASSASDSQRFTRQQRLLCASDYKSVFDDATFRVSHKYFLLLARSNTEAQSRLGLVVAKKNLRRAVDRNRIKRVVRNTFRVNPVVNAKVDIIFLSRRGIDELPTNLQNQVLREGWQKLMDTIFKTQAKQKLVADGAGEKPC